jgi:hypothetical protein
MCCVWVCAVYTHVQSLQRNHAVAAARVRVRAVRVPWVPTQRRAQVRACCVTYAECVHVWYTDVHMYVTHCRRRPRARRRRRRDGRAGRRSLQLVAGPEGWGGEGGWSVCACTHIACVQVSQLAPPVLVAPPVIDRGAPVRCLLSRTVFLFCRVDCGRTACNLVTAAACGVRSGSSSTAVAQYACTQRVTGDIRHSYCYNDHNNRNTAHIHTSDSTERGAGKVVVAARDDDTRARRHRCVTCVK